MDLNIRPVWAEVDLDAIKFNFESILDLIVCQLSSGKIVILIIESIWI